MAAADIDAAHALSVGVGWPHRLEDWRFIHGIGHGIVATDLHDGVNGLGLWCPCGDDVATIGMVIVKPGSQGRGIGRGLMRALIDAAGDRTIRLTATAAGQPLYQSMGFAVTGANTQHQGIVDWHATSVDAAVRQAEDRDWSVMAALDAVATGGDRTRLLQALKAVGTATVLERQSRICGYAICRPFGKGHVVGPLLADADADAIALASPHVRAHASRFLRVDTPKADGPFTAFLVASGLASVDRSALMTRGTLIPSKSAEIYALASQALS